MDMTLKQLFPTDFYFQFQVPNCEQIISLIDLLEESKSQDHNWASNCNVKTISLIKEEWKEYLNPSLKEFSRQIGYEGNIDIGSPWINYYSKGNFQEVHHHIECDFAAVFFANVGENFSRFYFQHRLAGLIPPKIDKLINLGDCWYTSINPGDMIVFPSYLLHGVTPHNSDLTRKTLSFNFTLCD